LRSVGAQALRGVRKKREQNKINLLFFYPCIIAAPYQGALNFSGVKILYKKRKEKEGFTTKNRNFVQS
jgi:hypothetical protein